MSNLVKIRENTSAKEVLFGECKLYNLGLGSTKYRGVLII